MIDWVNINSRYKSLIIKSYACSNIEKLPLDTSSLTSNAGFIRWFSEGDSSFQIRITAGANALRGGKYNNFSTTDDISQGRLNSNLFENYKDIMEKIAKLILANLGVVYLSKYDR